MKLFKDYAVLASGQVASKVVVFLAFAWLARALDPESYGAVEYLAGLALFFATLIDGGLDVIGVRRAARSPSELGVLAFQIRIARLLLAALAVPLMAFLALTAMKETVPAALVWLFVAGLATLPWRQEWLFQATERMAEAAIAQFLRVSVFAAMAFALVRGSRDLTAVGWAELTAAIAMTAYCVWFQHTRITPLLISGSLDGFSALVREGMAVGASNLVWATNQYAPLFLIGWLIGGTETAWFAGAARVVGSLLVFSFVYHYSLYPTVTRATARNDGELARILTVSCRVTAWAGILAALAITLLAEPLMTVALGPKMAAAAPMVRVMAWMLPVVLCSGHARWSLVAAGAQLRVLWSQAAGLLATVAVALVVGPRIGGLGFAYAALAGFCVVWIVSHIFAVRAGSTPPPFTLALRPALVAAALVVAVETLGPGVGVSLAGLLLFAAVAPLVDRKLVADIKALGNAKLDFRASGSGP
jgi:O-antigen/teichoic acid export membrane protein